ncbi:hypothetical protein C1646_709228 [Rhizophagus diaphanus]|nr:hypothetical protein C1646_709228 [Rhizophagus diaphanus] [Rhizophagus sp. MUCL 43196]
MSIWSLRFLGQLLSFYSVHLICNTIRGSRIGYIEFRNAHLETLTSGRRIWIQNFFLWIYFNYGFGFDLIQLLILFL